MDLRQGTKMNSYDRVMNRLQGKPVDYIPNLSLTMMFAAKEAGVTAEQIMEIVEKKLAVGRNHPGGFILSTACSIAPDVPPENIALLQKIVLADGEKYCI